MEKEMKKVFNSRRPVGQQNKLFSMTKSSEVTVDK
uniref:Uncharacterized protein n=1 Tax=Medicago truncatula TaxID=3880 RepID=Q2HTM5_MEDTR|nr:hypothetical protein MtrDRAFT_AC150244g18v2 [Medicago truncatula]